MLDYLLGRLMGKANEIRNSPLKSMKVIGWIFFSSQSKTFYYKTFGRYEQKRNKNLT